MNLELRHLDLVRTVVEEGGLTCAGKRLGLSQSALSHQLHAIEEQFAVSLFHRVGRRLVLAPAGERILRTAKLVIPEIERTEIDLCQDPSQLLGKIRLTADCYTCYQWLPGIARQFGRRFPGVDLRILTGATPKPVRALLKKEVDIAVVTRLTRDRRLKVTHLWDDELVVVTAAAHPLAERKYFRPQDFSKETLCSCTPFFASTLYLRVLRPARIRPKEVSEIPLTEAILEVVKAGFGIAVLARWVIRPYLANGEYRAIRITDRGLRRRWYAAVQSSKNPPHYLTAFLDALKEPTAALGRLG
jgi:LysR family transcriptional regulator, regulator for metE and metH